MAIATNFSRTSSLMLSNQLYNRLRETQNELLQKQKEITTGKSVLRPSDASDKASAILYLRQQLHSRDQWFRNLDHAQGMLDNTDAALGEAKDMLLEAKTIASGQVGIGSDSATRAAEAHVIQAHIDGLLTLANQQFNHLSLFGGNGGAAPDGRVFEEFMGGIRYLGSTDNLRADTGALDFQDFTSNGLDAFGALSARVRTQTDLGIGATSATPLSAVRGATQAGILKGPMEVSVNGVAVNVDLATADTMGDVVTRVNAAIASVDPAAGTLAIAGEGFTLTAAAGHTVTIADIGTGRTAQTLGIAMASAGGVPAAGVGVDPRLTPSTRLADLGAAIDWSSGLTITQGETTKVADFSAAVTVEDLANEIESLGLGLRLTVNEAGNGLDLVSEVSGLELSVGENGGTTASDLGIRTFSGETQLADFRNGLGVIAVEGEDDFSITLHDGTSFGVDLNGAKTVDDALAAIRDAATAAGVAPGAFTVGLATHGNGIVMQDATVGTAEFSVQNVGLSLAADHLGIRNAEAPAGTIAGGDPAKVRVESVFTHLMDLRDALRKDDTIGITLAGTQMEADLEKLVQSRAMVGVESQRVEMQRRRSEDMETTEKTMLSDLQDADLTEVITRFVQLQQQLQASMQVGAQNLQMSLLDFLG